MDYGVRIGERSVGGSKKGYTKEDDLKIEALWNEGAKVPAIAEALERTVFSIRYRIRFLQGKIKKAEKTA